MNIKRIIREESNDFKWIEDSEPYLNGVKFIYGDKLKPIYTIIYDELIHHNEVVIRWTDKFGVSEVMYKIGEVYENIESGIWNIVDDSGWRLFSGLNESNDFKWIEDIGIGEPIKIGGPLPNSVQYDDDDPKYPVDHVYMGDRVEFVDGYTFTIEEIKKDPLPPHNIIGVWGSDIPAPNKTFGPDRKLNYHFVEWLKRAYLNESNEFDWIEEIKPVHYKFFDVYFCDEIEYNDWDEEECVGDGGSYYIKIPFEDYNKIYHNFKNFDQHYEVKPGNVVKWMLDSDMIEHDAVDEIQNVDEITKEEFCRVIGIDNPDICYDTGQMDMFGGVIREEVNDFGWIEEHPLTVGDLITGTLPKGFVLEEGQKIYLTGELYMDDLEKGMTKIDLKNDTFIVKKRWVGFNSTDITSDRYGEPLRPAIHLIAPDNVYDTQAWYDWFKDTKWVSLGELKLDYPIQVNF